MPKESLGGSPYLTTAEVAAYLRLKERKVYDLAREGVIPCSKVTGKLLFPRELVDLWILNHLEGDQKGTRPLPRVLAGSSDPLLEWATRESGSELALLCNGSRDGASRLLNGDAMAAGVHVIDDGGRYNDPKALGLSGIRDLVIIGWARRRQGLLTLPDDPKGITRLADLARPEVRIVRRQPEAGAEALFRRLLANERIPADALHYTEHPARSEDDLALTIRNGDADVGLAIEAAARRHGLRFVPIQEERFDLALHRRSYFEPPIQKLLEFTRSQRFTDQVEALPGYDVSDLGEVRYNA